MNDLLTVQEVAELLRIDVAAVRRLVKEGTIPAVPLPHRAKRRSYLIKRKDVEEILKEAGEDDET